MRSRRTISAVALLTLALSLVLPAAAQDLPDNDYWWPDRLSLEPLRQASPGSSPPR